MFSDAIVGGNCNNGLHVGPFALNLNNAVSNSNWNIGAAHSYQNKINNPARSFPTPQTAEMRVISSEN